MSIITDATYRGETFEVEISHDGSLEFLNYNITHDQAALEFGYPVTVAINLLEAWNDDALFVICVLTQIPINYIARLALDWAEHVADAYTAYGYYDRGGADKLVSILNSARRQIGALEDEVTNETILNLKVLQRGANEKLGEHPDQIARHAAHATWSALAVLPASNRISDTGGRRMASAAAERARSTKAEYIHLVLMENEEAAKKEELWQIRRFVDCMEAVGQGFDWPDMKVTP
jgi:hypothetical protein